MITEVYSCETKNNAGPSRARFSTDPSNTNTWIRNDPLTCQIAVSIERKDQNVHILRSHEKTQSGRKMHFDALKDKLASYEINPFGGGPARHLTTIATPKGELRQCP